MSFIAVGDSLRMNGSESIFFRPRLILKLTAAARLQLQSYGQNKNIINNNKES